MVGIWVVAKIYNSVRKYTQLLLNNIITAELPTIASFYDILTDHFNILSQAVHKFLYALGEKKFLS